MSGHSKWHKIKRAKDVVDQKKSQLYGKLVREIQVAARHDSDPTINAVLREAITRARRANMPQANIDRLLKKKDQANFTEIFYEGFGPEGIALIIVGYTDNPNRTVSELRHLLKTYGGHLAEPNSVRWKFSEVMRATFDAVPAKQTEAFQLTMIDAGANDVVHDPDGWQVVTDVQHINTVLQAAKTLGFTPTQSERDFVSQQPQTISPDGKQAVDKLAEELSNREDIASFHLQAIQ